MPVPDDCTDQRRYQEGRHQSLANAIVQTVAYVDVFDYPLTPAEVHRYLIGIQASLSSVEELLSGSPLIPRRLERRAGYITLPGRGKIIETRQERAEIARQLWPSAVSYGELMADLPFVRMVAVTGSLAVNNAERYADIDYFVVTANDRLWLSRAFIILIVRLAARRGVPLCPNYLLSERALFFPEQNLYAAHELAQMVPLSGHAVYRRIRQLNRWAEDWLPNATSPPLPFSDLPRPGTAPHRVGRLLEKPLKTPLGAWLEQWEMNRKLGKFGRQAAADRTEGRAVREAQFAADWCKGHFDGHALQILEAYDERLHELGVEE